MSTRGSRIAQRVMANRIGSSTRVIAGEIVKGRVAAHEKHGENSIEAVPASETGRWLAILGEEFGEVCRALTYDQNMNLRDELLDVASVAVAWIAAIDAEED